MSSRVRSQDSHLRQTGSAGHKHVEGTRLVPSRAGALRVGLWESQSSEHSHAAHVYRWSCMSQHCCAQTSVGCGQVEGMEGQSFIKK